MITIYNFLKKAHAFKKIFNNVKYTLQYFDIFVKLA
jgi:hypothetical protein